MLRHFASAARPLAAALIVALGMTACGIKGPLVPAPKPDAAKPSDSEAPAPRKP
jgi:predicted small lipoprotein YifL